MIRPILACRDPYAAAQQLTAAGWKIDFSQPPESGDPLVGVSLFDNALLLGVTEGYVQPGEERYIGCGVVLYLTVPAEALDEVHRQHAHLNPSAIETQPWGDRAFEVCIDMFRLMIASV